MNRELRSTDIEIQGNVKRGIHFCQFYHSRDDLLDILVPYFKAGLENNEFCMLVTSEPLACSDAKMAMTVAIADFDRYIKSGQIEIVPHHDWYLQSGRFDSQRALQGWLDKLNWALTHGYDGLRIAGNTFWLENESWEDFTACEETVDNVIAEYPITALCTYCLDRCSPAEIIEIVNNHQYALIRKGGKQTTLESAELKRVEELLQQQTHDLGERVKELNCLYGMIDLIEKVEISLSEILQGTAHLIRSSWQYPEVCCARIIMDDQQFGTENFRETVWKQSCDIVVNGDQRGIVEVYYLEEKPDEYEGPFLKDERKLINAIGERLGKMVERKRAQEELIRSERDLAIWNRIDNVFLTVGDKEIHAEVLQVILEATESNYGMFGSIDENGDLVCLSMTRDIWNQYQVPDKAIVFPREDWGGLWAWYLTEGKSRYFNEGLQLPEGFPVHNRVLVVPIVYHGQSIGALVVTDKATDYSEKDQRLLEAIANHIGPILYSRLERDRNERERTRTEESLRESEAKYSTLIEQARDGVAIVQDGRIVYANRALAEMGGYSIEEIVGSGFLDMVAPGVRAFAKDVYTRRMAGELVPAVHDYRARAKDGREYDVETSAQIIQYKGRPAAMTIVRDVTARKREEREGMRRARRMEVLYAIADTVARSLEVDEIIHTIVNRATDLVNADACVAFMFDVEKGGARLKAHKGLPQDCIPALEWVECNKEEIAESSRMENHGRCVEATADKGLPIHVKATLQDKGFKLFYHLPFVYENRTLGAMVFAYRSRRASSDSDRALYAAMGKHLGVGIQRALVYEREREIRHELEKELARRGDFLRALVHELKTPLTSAMVSSEILSDILDEELPQALSGNLYRSISSLNMRTDELLDLTKAELGMVQLNQEPLDLIPMLEGMVEELAPMASNQGLLLTARLPASLPQVWADGYRLRQVILNLISNALKFTPTGETVTVEAGEETDVVVVTVRDTGPGINAEEQLLLFDPYYRGKRDKSRPQGLGLGLALSKTLVELHGGQIWVESQEGDGAAFSFYLPLQARTDVVPKR